MAGVGSILRMTLATVILVIAVGLLVWTAQTVHTVSPLGVLLAGLGLWVFVGPKRIAAGERIQGVSVEWYLRLNPDAAVTMKNAKRVSFLAYLAQGFVVLGVWFLASREAVPLAMWLLVGAVGAAALAALGWAQFVRARIEIAAAQHDPAHGSTDAS